MAESIQKILSRVRRPRVPIVYSDEPTDFLPWQLERARQARTALPALRVDLILDESVRKKVSRWVGEPSSPPQDG